MTELKITPPPELVQQWIKSGPADAAVNNAYERHIATCAAQWGADQELEACYEWLRAKYWICPDFTDELRAARRPKPPSLKELALVMLDDIPSIDGAHYNTIRHALEQLDD